MDPVGFNPIVGDAVEAGLTHLSLSVSDLDGVLALVGGLGGSVVGGTVSAQPAMIRDPDGQLIELLADSCWPFCRRVHSRHCNHYNRSGTVGPWEPLQM